MDSPRMALRWAVASLMMRRRPLCAGRRLLTFPALGALLGIVPMGDPGDHERGHGKKGRR